MRHPAVISLAAMAVLTVACHSDRSVRPPLGSPSASISDALHEDGNQGFFFKRPMVPDPSASFTAGKFNESVSPVVLICEGSGVTGTACTGTHIAEFTTATGPGSETVRLSLTDEHYIVNWHTDQFPLDPSLGYRINVFVGTTLLGFADVELGSKPGELKNVNTDEVVPLLDGRTLPIIFRIEDSALCGAPWDQFCNSETIVLADGGTVILEGTGDRVDIPPQPAAGDRVITVTLTLCDGIDVDLPRFGNCLTVTADPPLGDFRFSPTATVSMCSIVTEGVVLPAPPQDDLVTMYRQDNGDIFALPHTQDFCVDPIGQAPASLWQQLARAVGRLLAPRPLHATTVVIDVGEGGSTDFFSDFQLVLPAQLNADNDNESAEHPTDLGTHDPGASVTATVVVTDVLGAAVANATVRFTHVPPTGGTDGGALGPSPQCATVGAEHVCTSGADGRVAVTWTLSSTAGLNQLAAKTIGAGLHADLDGTGPFDSCVPDPLDLPQVDCTGTLTIPVDLTAGVVTFTANATSPVLINFETYPNGTPTCSDCAVSHEYSPLGAVFSFSSDFTDQDTPHIVLNANNPEGVSNHDVTSPPSDGGGRWVGTTIMTFSGGPGSVRFEARVNNSIAEIPVAAFEPDGDVIPTSQITRSNIVVYNPGSVDFRQETIEVTNASGVGRIELSGGGAGGFQILLDDLDFAPLGDQIAFTRAGGDGSEIFIMNADGTGQTSLTNSPEADFQPRWAPSGTRLAFARIVSAAADVHAMNRDGSGQISLTSNAASDQNPWWSPNGSQIVFESARDGNSEIYVMNADGTGQVNISNNSATDQLPAWSPDGAKIAFQSNRVDAGNPEGDNEIYIVNADGTGAFNLTNDGQFDMLPVWSPDGTTIVFQKSFDLEGEGFQFELYQMNADGSGEATNLTNNTANDFDPQWSPDGSRIAFVSERDGNREIYVLNVLTGALTRLTTNSAADDQPQWSPDGTRIAFRSNRDGNDEIYIMNADGTGQTRLTNNAVQDFGPRWAPRP